MKKTDPLHSIAESLRRIADMMANDREEARRLEEEAARQREEYVDPMDCDHPKEHRYDNSEGAILRRGCSLCGADDISAYRRKGALL